MFDGVSAHISGDRVGADSPQDVGEWFGRECGGVGVWGCGARLHRGRWRKVYRASFAEWCKLRMSTDANVLRRIVSCDEYVFHVSGIANTKNTHIWGAENL